MGGTKAPRRDTKGPRGTPRDPRRTPRARGAPGPGRAEPTRCRGNRARRRRLRMRGRCRKCVRRCRKCRARVPGPSRALRACPATRTGTMVKPRYKGRCSINPSRASTNPGTGGTAGRAGWDRTGPDRTEADVVLSPQIVSGARGGTTCGTERPSGASTCTGKRSAGERGPARGAAGSWPGHRTPRYWHGVAPSWALSARELGSLMPSFIPSSQPSDVPGIQLGNT